MNIFSDAKARHYLIWQMACLLALHLFNDIISSSSGDVHLSLSDSTISEQ
jgi:hypothetical protein